MSWRAKRAISESRGSSIIMLVNRHLIAIRRAGSVRAGVHMSLKIARQIVPFELIAP